MNKKINKEWKQNKRAGSIKKMLNNEYVDKEGSIIWLRNGLLKYNKKKNFGCPRPRINNQGHLKFP